MQTLHTFFLLMLSCTAFSSQKGSFISPEPSEKDFIARIKERYKDKPEVTLADRSMQLIQQKKYGPELADLLDFKFAVAEYQYLGGGIYKHVRGPHVHSYPRHMCEVGVTEEFAEKTHQKFEAPSFVDSFGHRHYAFPH